MFVRGDLQEDDQRDDNILHFFSPRSVMVYEAIITSGTFVLLGGLTLWHARLISKGETSIEAHINKSETKRLSQIGQNYKNPFDFGPYHNWCLFFGIIEGRSLSSVLLPSKHSPRGDGFQWDSVYSCGVKWNDLPILERFDPAKLAWNPYPSASLNEFNFYIAFCNQFGRTTQNFETFSNFFTMNIKKLVFILQNKITSDSFKYLKAWRTPPSTRPIVLNTCQYHNSNFNSMIVTRLSRLH